MVDRLAPEVGDERVMCFRCGRPLNEWEPLGHERHSDPLALCDQCVGRTASRWEYNESTGQYDGGTGRRHERQFNPSCCQHCGYDRFWVSWQENGHTYYTHGVGFPEDPDNEMEIHVACAWDIDTRHVDVPGYSEGRHTVDVVCASCMRAMTDFIEWGWYIHYSAAREVSAGICDIPVQYHEDPPQQPERAGAAIEILQEQDMAQPDDAFVQAMRAELHTYRPVDLQAGQFWTATIQAANTPVDLEAEVQRAVDAIQRVPGPEDF